MPTVYQQAAALPWKNDFETAICTLLTEKQYIKLIASIILAAEALLCVLIIEFVPYTEIDWTSYMQQCRLFLDGERDYALIKGDTGPLVYPAGHLYIYSALYHLTMQGERIKIAQYIFASIYLAVQAMIFTIFARTRSVPPYVLFLAALSKRLHSLYLLRLFNDCVGMLFFYVSLMFWTEKRPRWGLGSLFFGLALTVKMNFLLYVPGLLYLYVVHLGLLLTIPHLFTMLSPLVFLSQPFFKTQQTSYNYLSRAFDFSREFEWRWTVNWRWIGQDGFEEPNFSNGLLILHVLVLIVFGVEWARRDGGLFSLLRRTFTKPCTPASHIKPNPERIVTVLLTCNLMGILFARSLHYQFYAWYAQQIIFLLWHTPYDTFQRFATWGAIEFGWESFPSTINSSLGLCFANMVTLFGIYYEAPTGYFYRNTQAVPAEKDKEKTS